MRKTDRRVERTRANVAQAMRDLVLEMDYGDITVTEIARRAGVDRKTFYLHYASKDELMRELERQEALRLLDALRDTMTSEGPVAVEEVGQALDDLLASDIDLFRRIANTPSYRFLMEYEKDVIRQTLSNTLRAVFDIGPDVADLCAEFFASGMVSTYMAWMRSEGTVAREDIARIVVTASCNSINDLPFPRREGAPEVISAYVRVAMDDLARRVDQGEDAGAQKAAV